MVGQSSGIDPGTTDWLNKATPDQLVTQGTALISKIAQMDSSYQDQFIRQLQNNPQAARLFERVGTAA